jgi:hypothetical protein
MILHVKDLWSRGFALVPIRSAGKEPAGEVESIRPLIPAIVAALRPSVLRMGATSEDGPVDCVIDSERSASRIGLSPVQNRPQPVSGILLHRRQGVRIGRQRHLDPFVPEPLLHDMRRHSGLEQQRGTRVAHAVKLDPAYA